MFSEKIKDDNIVINSGTSEGTQIKYRKGNYWYKKDSRGHEGLAEYLSSRLLTYSNLAPEQYAIYEQGTINGAAGCRSKNFLKQGEELITFYRLYFNATGRDLSKVTAAMDTMEERIAYTVNFIKNVCRIDVSEYLKRVFTLDWIILNEDRHFNNLAVLVREDSFAEAPVFDNGVSLLTANQSVNWHFSMEENVKRVIARPFSGSHEKTMKYFGTGFSLDFPAVYQWLDSEEDSRERDVLEYQVRRFEARERSQQSLQAEK